MHVCPVPSTFDDRTLDQFAAGLPPWPPAGRLLVDAHGVTWTSPHGLVALLTLGQWVQEHGGEKPRLALPESEDVRRYWAAAGFVDHAEACYELHGRRPRGRPSGHSETMLEVTKVGAAEDVHEIVARIQTRASALLVGELGLEAKATMGFAMALSEACQNIVEHAGTSGWVAVQAYHYRQRLARKVAVIAVSDAGMGFRASLEATQARNFGDRWRDGTAIEAALLRGTSRFRDPGRGQGLQGIRRYVSRWEGKLSVRSGTARLAMVPAWDDEPPLAEALPFFPGAQVQITIPGKDTARA